jgi:hypothetical protein
MKIIIKSQNEIKGVWVLWDKIIQSLLGLARMRGESSAQVEILWENALAWVKVDWLYREEEKGSLRLWAAGESWGCFSMRHALHTNTKDFRKNSIGNLLFKWIRDDVLARKRLIYFNESIATRQNKMSHSFILSNIYMSDDKNLRHFLFCTCTSLGLYYASKSLVGCMFVSLFFENCILVSDFLT